MDFSYQAKGRVESLKRRAERCLCKYCGEKLKLRRIIFSDHEDARVEIFCDQCDRIEYGVEPEIYYSAKYFVEELKFNCYPNMDDNNLTRQMTIAKVGEIMSWSGKNLGFINEEGFQVPVKVNERIIGECVVLTDKDIDNEPIDDYDVR